MPKRTMADLIKADFFFVDIVGLSDPTMPTKMQIKKLTFLYKSIGNCAAYKSTSAKKKLVLPTGDGVAIGFLQGPERPELPLELAIQLHQKIKKYNEGRIPSESLYVRIGIHSGPVFTVKDLEGNRNIWGPGIILARRVMDLGDDGHILVSSNFAKMFLPLSSKYGEYLHELGPHILKHNLEMVVYSAYSNSGRRIFGNQSWPKKLEPRSPMVLYPYIEVNIRIMNPDRMFVHYRRVYEIQNVTEEPVRTVTHQIATDVAKSWDELNIKVVDDEGKDLVISEIEVNKPKQKKFDTTFARPLKFGDKRRYILEYDVEEPDRSFENIFLVKCGKFVVNIDYPLDGNIHTPTAYDVNTEQEKITKCSVQPIIRPKGRNRCIADWSIEDCFPQQSFRFEW
jgi:hypothetical protein